MLKLIYLVFTIVLCPFDNIICYKHWTYLHIKIVYKYNAQYVLLRCILNKLYLKQVPDTIIDVSCNVYVGWSNNINSFSNH